MLTDLTWFYARLSAAQFRCDYREAVVIFARLEIPVCEIQIVYWAETPLNIFLWIAYSLLEASIGRASLHSPRTLSRHGVRSYNIFESKSAPQPAKRRSVVKWRKCLLRFSVDLLTLAGLPGHSISDIHTQTKLFIGEYLCREPFFLHEASLLRPKPRVGPHRLPTRFTIPALTLFNLDERFGFPIIYHLYHTGHV